MFMGSAWLIFEKNFAVSCDRHLRVSGFLYTSSLSLKHTHTQTHTHTHSHFFLPLILYPMHTLSFTLVHSIFFTHTISLFSGSLFLFLLKHALKLIICLLRTYTHSLSLPDSKAHTLSNTHPHKFLSEIFSVHLNENLFRKILIGAMTWVEREKEYLSGLNEI